MPHKIKEIEKKHKTLRSYLQPRSSDNYYGDLKDISVPTLTTQHSNKVSQFHKTLKNATGKKLLKLQVNATLSLFSHMHFVNVLQKMYIQFKSLHILMVFLVYFV